MTGKPGMTPPGGSAGAGSRRSLKLIADAADAFCWSMRRSAWLFKTTILIRRLTAAAGLSLIRLTDAARPNIRLIFGSAMPPATRSLRAALARSAESSQLLYSRSPVAYWMESVFPAILMLLGRRFNHGPG